MPIRVGSSWVQVVKILGRPTNLTARVIECREPESGVVGAFHWPRPSPRHDHGLARWNRIANTLTETKATHNTVLILS